MSKDKIEVNMNVYDIPILVEALEEANKEIERLKELCDKYEEEHNTTFETWQKDIKENKLLHSIIKEVREYIAHYVDNEYRNGRDDELYLELNEKELKELLEILDKVEEE